jgi:hypothetical protein
MQYVEGLYSNEKKSIDNYSTNCTLLYLVYLERRIKALVEHL